MIVGSWLCRLPAIKFWNAPQQCKIENHVLGLFWYSLVSGTLIKIPLFQTMHKHKIIFFTFCCNAFLTYFLVILSLSVYRQFYQNRIFSNSCIDRRPLFSLFLSSHFLYQIQRFQYFLNQISIHPILGWACFGIFTISALIYGYLLLKWIRSNTGDAMYVIQYQLLVTLFGETIDIQLAK